MSMLEVHIDLESAIADARAEHRRRLAANQEAERKQEAERQAELQLKQDRAREDLQDQIDRELPEVLQQALGLEIEVYDSYYPYAHGVITADGERWHTWPHSSTGWRLKLPTGEDWTAPQGDLQHYLLLALAHIRQRRREQAAEAERQAQEQAEIEQQIAAELEQTRASLWRWPEGRTLTIYRWIWTTGANSEYGAEHDDAWSLRPRLDYDGDPDGGGWLHTAGGRDIRLIPSAHLPIVEATDMRGLADVPSELRHKVYHTIDGIRARGTSYDDYGEPIAAPPYERVEGAREMLEVGEEPADWIKRAVECPWI